MKQVVYILILGQDMGDQSICCSTRLDRAIVSCVGVGGGMREGAVGFFFFFSFALFIAFNISLSFTSIRISFFY